jgi:hypothetical protein
VSQLYPFFRAVIRFDFEKRGDIYHCSALARGPTDLHYVITGESDFNFLAAALDSLEKASKIYAPYFFKSMVDPNYKMRLMSDVEGAVIESVKDIARKLNIPMPQVTGATIDGIRLMNRESNDEDFQDEIAHLFDDHDFAIRQEYALTTDFWQEYADAPYYVAETMLQSLRDTKVIRRPTEDILYDFIDDLLEAAEVNPKGVPVFQKHQLPTLLEVMDFDVKRSATGNVFLNEKVPIGKTKKEAHAQIAMQFMRLVEVFSQAYSKDAVIRMDQTLPDIKTAFIKPGEFLKKEDGKPKRPRFIYIQSSLYFLISYYLYHEAIERGHNNLESGSAVGFVAKGGGALQLVDTLFGVEKPEFREYLQKYEPDYVAAYDTKDYLKLQELFSFRERDISKEEYSVSHLDILFAQLALMAVYDNEGAYPGSWTMEQYVNLCLFNQESAFSAFNFVGIDPKDGSVIILIQVGSGAYTTSYVDTWFNICFNKSCDRDFIRKLRKGEFFIPRHVAHQKEKLFAALRAFGIERVTYGDDLAESTLKIINEVYDEGVIINYHYDTHHVVLKSVSYKDDRDQNLPFFSTVENGNLATAGLAFLQLYFVLVDGVPQFFRPYDVLVPKIMRTNDPSLFALELSGKLYHCYGTNKRFHERCSQVLFHAIDRLRQDFEDPELLKLFRKLKIKTSCEIDLTRPETYLKPYQFFRVFFEETTTSMLEFRHKKRAYWHYHKKWNLVDGFL